MSYEIDRLRGFSEKLVTAAAPLIVEFPISGVDVGMLWLALTISAVNGAGPTYANAKIQTTFNGTDWEDVVNVQYEPVTATGVFKQYFTTTTGIVAPLCRIVVTAVAAHDVYISNISRGTWTEEGSYPGRVQGPGGALTVTIGAPKDQQAAVDSVAVTLSDENIATLEEIRDEPVKFVLDNVVTDTEQDTAVPANNTGLPVVLLAGQAKVPVGVTVRNNLLVEQYAGLVPERWNGLTVAYPIATQETYAFFQDQAKTILICTVTVDYVDATKEQLLSVTRV